MINARVIPCGNDSNNSPSLQEQSRASVVSVTPENATRLLINNAFMMETADRLPEGVYPIRVVANFKGALNGLSRSDLEYVLGLPANSQPPDYALIRVPRPTAVAIRPGLDAELFPVFYATQSYAKTTIKLALHQMDSLVPSQCAHSSSHLFGSTVYKVQGETLQSMIVMDWKSTQALVNKPQPTYLLVPRVTTRKGLIALAPMTKKLVEWSKPPEHAL
ncbi:LOW QUALITY PROTEIN: hypothetical protein PHMEG_00038937, partial [Phytophthora megakarya]